MTYKQKNKLTWEKVDEMRSYCNSKSCGELSKMYGITPQCVAKILTHKHYKLSSRPAHLPPPPDQAAYLSKQCHRSMDIDRRDPPRKTPLEAPLPAAGSWQRIAHGTREAPSFPRLSCPV